MTPQRGPDGFLELSLNFFRCPQQSPTGVFPKRSPIYEQCHARCSECCLTWAEPVASVLFLVNESSHHKAISPAGHPWQSQVGVQWYMGQRVDPPCDMRHQGEKSIGQFIMWPHMFPGYRKEASHLGCHLLPALNSLNIKRTRLFKLLPSNTWELSPGAIHAGTQLSHIKFSETKSSSLMSTKMW